MFSNIILRIYHTKNLGNWYKPSSTARAYEIQMWSISGDIHASKICNWSDHLSRELVGFRESRTDRQKSIVCVGRFTTFLSIQQKRGEDVWVHGVCVFKKLKILKMKTRQYDTDEACDYGDAVPVLPEILHNSGFDYKVKMAAGVFTVIQRNAETQSQIIQQTSGYMDHILF